MDFFKEKFFAYLKDNFLAVLSLIFCVINLGLILNLYLEDKQKINQNINDATMIKEDTTQDAAPVNDFYVDVKGEVKKPGVYKVNDGIIINDVIKIAGGLTKKANTTNINLSKKVTAEMLIYVSSNSEINGKTNYTTTDKSITSSNSDATKDFASSSVSTATTNETQEKPKTMVSINKASVEELMSLPNIGEAKAKSIISYRETNGNFKSIDDIKKVSGIGDSLFAKIKDYITI